MSTILDVLNKEDQSLLEYECKTFPKDQLHLPGPDFLDRVLIDSNRPVPVLRNLAAMYNHGRLSGTGYLSILPVDQGLEHTAGSAFAPNPIYFDPENIVKLGIEGGCNAVASTLGILGAVARKYAHKIPFILKMNHSELLSYPNTYDQRYFASVKQAFELGAVGVGATIYFGSEESRRQIEETTKAFELAHELGMFTVLWAYLRNPAFKQDDKDYHFAADLTGQANYLSATIGADIIKQKQPTCNGGFTALKFGKTHPYMYEKLSEDHPIALTRYQVINCFLGRSGLINSGGPSGGNDLHDAATPRLSINARAAPV